MPKISYRLLMSVAGLCLLGACTGVMPPPSAQQAPPANEPQLAGAWYQIFFDNDAAEINPRGRMIIQTVANVVANDNRVHVTIVGKTDRTGGPAANRLLSQQRADGVRDALLALSVPASNIDTSWSGENKQDVATPDNVAEQRNRVVDITVQRPYE